LCFEAVRWNDLRRWGETSVIQTNQAGNPILNQGVAGTYAWTAGNDFNTRYAATKGFFKVPESQIVLSEGVLTQNEGWDSNCEWAKGDLPYYKK